MKFFFLLFYVAILGAAEKIDILFHLQDAGETYALLPVVRQLQEKGASVQVLAAGVAQDILPSDLPRRSFPHLTVDKKWSREQLVDPSVLKELASQLEPKVVVTGVAYALQGQVLDLFHAQGASTVAYWDNFSAEGSNAYFSTARAVAKKAEMLFVPTYSLGCALTESARVVGQPTLEEWKQAVEDLDQTALRQKLGICLCRNVILWIGGYGAEYEESLRLFARSVQEKDGPAEMFLLVQPHPKTPEGALEEQVLESVPLPHRVLQKEVTTQEAVALSTAVACHQSTVAFQARACGKPVLYFFPSSQQFQSSLIDFQLAAHVKEPSDFPSAWQKAMEARQLDFFQTIGAPCHSASLCVEALLGLLD